MGTEVENEEESKIYQTLKILLGNLCFMIIFLICLVILVLVKVNSSHPSINKEIIEYSEQTQSCDGFYAYEMKAKSWKPYIHTLKKLSSKESCERLCQRISTAAVSQNFRK